MSKKLIIFLIISFLFFGCTKGNLDNSKELNNVGINLYNFKKNNLGTLSLDNIILNISSIDKLGGEKVIKLLYSNFDSIVLDINNIRLIDNLDLYKGKELLIHIDKNFWDKYSFKILKKLSKLNLNLLNIDIRSNDDVKKLLISEEQARIISKFLSKNIDINYSLKNGDFGQINCSKNTLNILGIESCDIISIRK